MGMSALVSYYYYYYYEPFGLGRFATFVVRVKHAQKNVDSSPNIFILKLEYL